MKTILTTVLLLALLGAGGYYYYARYIRSEGQNNFRTSQVERGEMLPTIGATGTIEPEEVVDIGAQVTGPLTDLNATWGTMVDAHQKLAQIDPAKYEAARDQAAASVVSAKANLDLAKANVLNADATLRRDTELRRDKPGAIAPAQIDIDTAAAGVAHAQVGVAAANIKQQEAMLKSAQTDLDYTHITSPVKGVIIDRRVNEGETVVSALSASSLFLLAKDLSRIQIWASVNEADIGRIQVGQRATFTVDTFPNETFVGAVTQVRLNATMTQNVVTYTVVVTTPNPDFRLLPYMTATVNFEIEQHKDVLKVPNAALRWKPRPAQIAPDIRADTLSEMNRRADRSKSKHSDDKAKKSDDTVAAQSASPGAQPAAPAAPDGTAGNAADWKARLAQEHDQRQHHNKSAGGKEQGKAQQADAGQGKKVPAAEQGPPGKVVSPAELAAKKENYESGYVWTVDGNYVRPVKVKIIATDGTMTEIRGKNLRDDIEVVTGENVVSDSDDTTNPFMPKIFHGGSKSK